MTMKTTTTTTVGIVCSFVEQGPFVYHHRPAPRSPTIHHYCYSSSSRNVTTGDLSKVYMSHCDFDKYLTYTQQHSPSVMIVITSWCCLLVSLCLLTDDRCWFVVKLATFELNCISVIGSSLLSGLECFPPSAVPTGSARYTQVLAVR